jgi:lipopolysaccharide export system permease protein
MRIPLLDRIQAYVLVRALFGVLMALAVIAAILLLVDFVAISRDVGVRAKETSVAQLLGLTLLQTPSVVLVLFPFAFLFGVLGAFVNMNRRSELTAMRAAGVSAWRFTLPAAVAAALVGVFAVTALNPVASALNDRYERDKAALMSGYLNVGPKTLWLRQGDRAQQVIIRAAARRGDAGVVLQDVAMFVFAVEPGGGLRFTHRIDAKQARLEKGRWVLSDARDGVPGQPAVLSPQLSLPSTLDQRSALERFSSPAAIPFWTLPGMIARTEAAGFSAVSYRLQLQQLLATPLMYAAMAILAAAFSLRLMRLGGLGALSGAAVALGFLFFFVGKLCEALGKAEVVPAVLAAWAPASLALLAGVTLLLYTEDG